MQWVLPTFLIKAFMALIMGYVINKWHHKGNWLLGAVLGGIFQIMGYTAVKIFYYGFATAMVMTPGLLVQTSFRSCTDFYIRGCFGHHWHFTKSKGDVDI